MCKTIFLELTENEAEVVKNALTKEYYFWQDKDISEFSRNTIDAILNHCNTLWAKLDEAHNKKSDILITYKEFFNIKSLAKEEFHNLQGNVYLSNKKVEEQDVVNISLASAMIMWLNSKNLIKRLARFDFTDHSSEYEEIND